MHAHYLLLDKLCGFFRGLRKLTPSYAVLLLCNQQTALIKILRNKNNYLAINSNRLHEGNFGAKQI